MGFKISSLKQDPRKLEGIWMEYCEGAEVQLTSADNPDYFNFLQKLIRDAASHPITAKRIDPSDPEQTKEYEAQAFATCVFKGWKGFDDDDEKELPNTVEARTEALVNFPQFYRELIIMAQRRDEIIKILEKESEGNLLKASNGTPNGEISKLP